MKNLVLFVGVLVGAALLVAGFVAIDRGDRMGWYYVGGAACAFVLATGPGRRLKDAFLIDRPKP